MKSSLEIDPSGTCFFGTTVLASLNQILKVLGDEHFSTNKTTHDWACKMDSGEIVTVYNWKTGRPKPDQKIDWHIGGFNKESTEMAKMELENSLRDG